AADAVSFALSTIPPTACSPMSLASLNRSLASSPFIPVLTDSPVFHGVFHASVICWTPKLDEPVSPRADDRAARLPNRSLHLMGKYCANGLSTCARLLLRIFN